LQLIGGEAETAPEAQTTETAAESAGADEGEPTEEA
jgi:hypothetical protein